MSSKYSQEKKLAAVQAHIKGEGGIRQIARDYQVSRGALIQWVAYYKKNGCLPDTTPKTTPSPHPPRHRTVCLQSAGKRRHPRPKASRRPAPQPAACRLYRRTSAARPR